MWHFRYGSTQNWMKTWFEHWWCSSWILSPSNHISPSSGCIWPPIRRNNVVLPMPDGPIIAVTLPFGTRKLTLSKILRPEREKVRLLIITKSLLDMLSIRPLVLFIAKTTHHKQINKKYKALFNSIRSLSRFCQIASKFSIQFVATCCNNTSYINSVLMLEFYLPSIKWSIKMKSCVK